MKKIRIGKDIGVRWKIRTPFNDDPLSVSDISIDMKDPRGTVVPVRVFEIIGDTVTFGLKGTAFAYLGDYTFSCWKNKGKDGQTVVDAVSAFTLVSSTDKETGAGRGGCGVLELSTVDLYSQLEFFFSGQAADTSVERRVAALETNVARLASQMSGLQTAISQLEQRVTALEDGGQGGDPDVIEITGVFSYSNASVSASGGTATPTNTMQLVKNGTVQQVSFTFSSNQSYASVNNSTGVVTFSASQSTSQRTATITASCTFEGQTYSRTATVTQAAYVATVYSVTRTLTGVISSNTDNSVNEGNSYTTTLTLVSGYENMQVTVTMGGVDITNTVLSGNIITISEVTDNIIITASATKIPVVAEYVYAGSAKNMTSDPVAISQFTAGASSTTKTVNYTPTEVVNTIIAVCPSTMSLTSCVKHGEIEDDITDYMLASASNVTYENKSCKMYQFKYSSSIRNNAFTITFN